MNLNEINRIRESLSSIHIKLENYYYRGDEQSRLELIEEIESVQKNCKRIPQAPSTPSNPTHISQQSRIDLINSIQSKKEKFRRQKEHIQITYIKLNILEENISMFNKLNANTYELANN